jgi:small-conductance mechanosensitive channel
MHPSQLQNLLGIDELSRDTGALIEAMLAVIGMLAAIAVRRHRRSVTPTTFMLLSISILLDATSHYLRSVSAGDKVAVAAYVLFLFGLVRLILEGLDAMLRRGKVHFSTIVKESLMILLWAVVVMIVMYTDFGVQPLSLLTGSAVVAAVVGFALQETLGNIFAGLSVMFEKPFEPGDWIRSGTHVGRVRGIGWRSTTIDTRASERLEIPNAMVAKDVLFNYATGGVADEVSVGISYAVPPNHVREVVKTLLHDTPQVMRVPAPEVLAWEYGDSAIRYRVKYWISDYGALEHIRDQVVSSLWYALRRHSIEIPFPMRTIQMKEARTDEKADAAFERELMNELRNVDWLRGLSEEELKTLVPSVSVRQFGAGEMLVRQDEPGESMFIFRSGAAELFMHAADGQPVHIKNYARGDFTGEMALMTGDPRTASVRALTDVEVIEMDREGFARLFKDRPDAAAAISEVIAARNAERLQILSASEHGDGKATPRRWLMMKMRELLHF